VILQPDRRKKLEYWAAEAMYYSDTILSKKKENDMCE